MAYGIQMIGAVFLLGFVLYCSISQRKRNSKLPPRPPGLPLVGNIPQFATAAKKSEIHLQLGEWARGYGDIFRVKLGPVELYYLNTAAAVKELFDRNSAATAERPRLIVSNELLCNMWNVLLLNASTPRWKHQRKVIHSEMTSVPRANAGIPFLNYETMKFLHEVANDPDAGTAKQDLWAQIGRYTYSTFAMQSFGFEIAESEDPSINLIHESGLRQILGTLPFANIVDMLPLLNELPMLLKPWERRARAYFKSDMQFIKAKKEQVMANHGVIHSQESLLRRVLNDEKLLGFESVDEAAFLSLQLIIGAADTSKMSTMSFLEAMMAYPEVQKKGQEAIDRVVGDRVPRYEDLELIPYVRCLMKELWRWRPPVALGHPHQTTRDLEYKGMLIPKGSRLHINAWAIHRDPARYENPEAFKPERYEGDLNTSQESANSPNVRDRDHFAFGAGRRICPGYHVAERSLAMSIMRILWAFDVKPSPAAKLPLNPSDYYGAMPGNPGPALPACLTLRNPDKATLIEKYWEEEKASQQVAV